MSEDVSYWLGFSAFPGIGPVRFRLLHEFFGSAKAAWEAPIKELKTIHLGEKLISEFDTFRKTFDLEGYAKRLTNLHVNTLIQTDPKFPQLLKEIPDAPFLLYVKGRNNTTPIDMKRTIGVVGTRKVTPYGIDVTRRLVTDLVDAGFTIVSGMAYGVDAVAHETAIAAGGKTIAVLGCGIDIIAPPVNAHIYRKLTDEGYGAVVTEMPLGLRPNKGLFPARNRIISGLSLGIVVTEGANDSGALITAKNAAEQGREVFAVPGQITSPYSRGPAILLKNGATLVESVDDILSALGVAKKIAVRHTEKRRGKSGSVLEEKIVKILEEGPTHIDTLVTMVGRSVSEISSVLTVLELEGVIKDRGEKIYEINFS